MSDVCSRGNVNTFPSSWRLREQEEQGRPVMHLWCARHKERTACSHRLPHSVFSFLFLDLFPVFLVSPSLARVLMWVKELRLLLVNFSAAPTRDPVRALSRPNCLWKCLHTQKGAFLASWVSLKPIQLAVKIRGHICSPSLVFRISISCPWLSHKLPQNSAFKTIGITSWR